MSIHFSCFDKETDLLKAIIDLHIPGRQIDLDPMFFKGNFYKDGVAIPRMIGDISPRSERVPKLDARKLPYNNLDSIILDPPFLFGVHGKTKKYYSSKTHGILKDFDALKELYIAIIGEAYRALNKKGVLIFKCQDYTDSKTTMTHCYVWQWAIGTGFYAKDLAVLNKTAGKIYNSKLTQRHLRKSHSYFWVFEK